MYSIGAFIDEIFVCKYLSFVLKMIIEDVILMATFTVLVKSEYSFRYM